MHYQFPPDLEKLVRERMALGRYTSEDDVLRDALRALEKAAPEGPCSPFKRITSVEELRRELQYGIDSLDRGEGRDAEEVFDELLRDLPEIDEEE